MERIFHKLGLRNRAALTLAAARLAAARELLDRAYGKPRQQVDLTAVIAIEEHRTSIVTLVRELVVEYVPEARRGDAFEWAARQLGRAAEADAEEAA